MKDRESISYVIVDGKMVISPGSSGAILKVVRPGEFPETILNRSEMRVLVGNDGNVFDVAQHNVDVPKGLKLQHSSALTRGWKILMKQLLMKRRSRGGREEGRLHQCIWS